MTGSGFGVYTQEAESPVMPLILAAWVQSLGATIAALMLRFGSKGINITEVTSPEHD